MILVYFCTEIWVGMLAFLCSEVY